MTEDIEDAAFFITIHAERSAIASDAVSTLRCYIHGIAAFLPRIHARRELR